QTKTNIAPGRRQHCCHGYRAVNEFPLRTIVILVEGADGIHHHASADVEQRVKVKVERGELYRDFFGTIFKLNLRQEPDLAVDGRRDKQGHAWDREVVTFGDTVGSHVFVVCFNVSTHGDRSFANLQEWPAVNGVHVHSLSLCSIRLTPKQSAVDL